MAQDQIKLSALQIRTIKLQTREEMQVFTNLREFHLIFKPRVKGGVDVVELRQRIQNILQTNESNSMQAAHSTSPHYQTYQANNNILVSGGAGATSGMPQGNQVALNQNYRMTPQPTTSNQQKLLGEQIYIGGQGTGDEQVKVLRPPSNNQIYQATSAGSIPTLKQNPLMIGFESNQGETDFQNRDNIDLRLSISKRHHIQASSQTTNVAPSLTNHLQHQPQILQRLLSEERDSNDANNAAQLSSRIKLGFQENLNRRGSNHHISHNLGPGQSNSNNHKCVNSNLNKAAIVTMITSNQQTTLSDSSKFNSQLVKSSLWLLTSTAAIKNKRVQDIIQQRQKCCQFCQNTNKERSISPYGKSLGGKVQNIHQYSGCQGSQNSNSIMPYRENLRNLVRESLDKKYLTSQDYYNSKIVSDIMYNENRHIVSVFKDYLIFDDFSEYLKRYYRDYEAYDRLPKVFEFYEKYSKVFPNYVSLPGESKYMFKNIERKQKLIDEKHQQLIERQEKVKADHEEAKALGVALDSSVIQRLRQSKNMIFGSQFMNDLTELQQNSSENGDQSHLMLRQQSSKILEMLNTIQSNAPTHTATSVINQIKIQQQVSNASTARQGHSTIFQQSQVSNRENMNLEFLINQLAQFDNRNESLYMIGFHGAKVLDLPSHLQPHSIPDDPPPFIADISMSSSHGMSSFLQDFDLREGGQDIHHNKFDIQNYRTQPAGIVKNELRMIGAGLDDDQEELSRLVTVVVDTPFKRTGSGGRGSVQDNKRTSTKNLQTQPSGSRQSMQAIQTQTRITPTSINNPGNSKLSSHGQTVSSQQTKNLHGKKKSSIKNYQGSSGMSLGQNSQTNYQSNQPHSKTQWSNMMLSKKQDSVRKPTGLVTNNKGVNLVSNLAQGNQLLSSSNKASMNIKQPTPKNRKNFIIPVSQNSNQIQGLGGSISPQAINIPLNNSSSRANQRQSMHSADSQNQQIISAQFHTLQPQMIQQVINSTNLNQGISQHLSASSLKNPNNHGISQNQQQYLNPQGIPNSGGRTSQISLGSPLSQHSSSTVGGLKNTQGLKQKQTIITKEMIQSMPPGYSLKQIATAAAKANLGQQRQSISGSQTNPQQSQETSAKKASTNTASRASIINSGQPNTKPNIQIPLQHNPHQQLLPRSGPNAIAKGESFKMPGQSTPSSVGSGLQIQAQLGSAGNSQSSMRISPDFSLVPNNLLMYSGHTSVGSGPLKKVPEVSKSFKISTQGSNSQIQSKLNPTQISQSIKEAVNKLLPPQPRSQQQYVSSSMQYPNHQNPLKINQKQVELTLSPTATIPPQSLQTNTAAIFNKLFAVQSQVSADSKSLQGGQGQDFNHSIAPSQPGIHPGKQQQIEEDNHAQQLSAVYSTRIPQKKNFSSPDDLQQRIAARKNHQQYLAMTTAQNTLQPLRKSANDFYDSNKILTATGGNSQSISPQQIPGKKLLVVLKPRNGSPISAANCARIKKAGTNLGSDGSDNQEYQMTGTHDHIPQRQMYLYGGSLGGEDVEEAVEEQDDQDEQDDEIDERNDVYTAKGHRAEPINTVNQQVQAIRGRDNMETINQQIGALRQMAQSATATSSTNAYNFKVSSGIQGGTVVKRNPSTNSDKSHTSSMKSNYSSVQNQHPYQRVLSSLSTGTKKKVKVGQESSNPSNVHGPVGGKLYEKIKSGIQQSQNTHGKNNNLAATYNTHQTSTHHQQSVNAGIGKKKPTTIFTFNK